MAFSPKCRYCRRKPASEHSGTTGKGAGTDAGHMHRHTGLYRYEYSTDTVLLQVPVQYRQRAYRDQ
jgi:hypothetical protein